MGRWWKVGGARGHPLPIGPNGRELYGENQITQKKGGRPAFAIDARGISELSRFVVSLMLCSEVEQLSQKKNGPLDFERPVEGM